MKKIGVHSIEDCLEILVGLQKHELVFQIEKRDENIITSIARQIYKGVALTDRQYNLMKEKLITYKPQFENQDVIGFDRALGKLRKPLREIDRNKYITIVDHPKDIVYPSDQRGQFIKIRFPFKKSDIVLIDEINKTKDYHHKKGSHEHYFVYNEQNTYKLLSRFKDKKYKIDQELLDLYTKIEEIRANEENYVPGIYNNKLKNVHPRAKDIAESEIGVFGSETKLMYIDRRRRYGIENICQITPISLTEEIAYRSEIMYQSPPSEQRLDNVLLALKNLDRFPLLVILEKSHAETQLREMINFYRDIIPTENQSVLFRQEGNTEFNQMIKDRNLNNWVDNNTKIVYISSNGLPKLLINNEWQPCATFSYTSRVERTLDSYVYNRCDLVVYREDMISPMRKYSQYYG